MSIIESEIDYTMEHQMACGHQWIPNKLPCNFVVDKKWENGIDKETGKSVSKMTLIRCEEPSNWYCPDISCHARRCPKHFIKCGHCLFDPSKTKDKPDKSELMPTFPGDSDDEI